MKKKFSTTSQDLCDASYKINLLVGQEKKITGAEFRDGVLVIWSEREVSELTTGLNKSTSEDSEKREVQAVKRRDFETIGVVRGLSETEKILRHMDQS